MLDKTVVGLERILLDLFSTHSRISVACMEFRIVYFSIYEILTKRILIVQISCRMGKETCGIVSGQEGCSRWCWDMHIGSEQSPLINLSGV